MEMAPALASPNPSIWYLQANAKMLECTPPPSWQG